MIDSKWQNPVGAGPNMAKLIDNGHVSKAAVHLQNFLVKSKGWTVQQEICIPNTKPGKSPFHGDFYIFEKNLVIELDGHHHTADKKKQENRKDAQIREMGSDVIHIPFVIPSHLVYGHLKDPEWGRVKKQYHNWFNTSFCPQVILAINKWEKTKFKKN